LIILLNTTELISADGVIKFQGSVATSIPFVLQRTLGLSSFRAC